MLIVGLTGGIGCGKSTATKLFAKHHAPILDADAIAHQLCEPDAVGYHAILKHFGATVLNDDKHINRQKLSQLVFNNQSEKQWLEATLHPMILQHIQTELTTLEQMDIPYCIIDIPLIKQRNQFELLDRVLVVDCSVELQITRTQQRDHIDEKAVRNIMSHQCSREQRLELADDVLQNEGSLEALTENVNNLHSQYLSKASNRS